jgi:ankyrin repeat protein
MFAICCFGLDTILDDWLKTGPAYPWRRDKEGNLLLHLPVISGSLGVTGNLLSLLLDINAGNSRTGGYPLSVAANNASMQMM